MPDLAPCVSGLARRTGLVGLILLMLTLGFAEGSRSSKAAGVVTDCTEAGLDAALAGGGHVTFVCGPDPITITVTAEKFIDSDTTIDGGGLVSLSGGGTTRVLQVNPGVHLRLDNLTIRDGVGSGGAISNIEGMLTLTNVTVANNHAPEFACCGAIFNVAGTATLINSTVSDNTAGVAAGIGNAAGTLTLITSSVSNNVSLSDGGGISNVGGTLTLVGSTVAGNSANNAPNGRGGGIIHFDGTATLINSTISDNSAAQGGGVNNLAALTLINSTVSGNSAVQGGGIYNDRSSGSAAATFTNTIIGHNEGGNCDGFLDEPVFVDGGRNLDADGTCEVGPATNPLLDPEGLANNGGSTQTIALLPNSPAVDRVPLNSCIVTTDQRGVARPQDGDGDGVASCDSGAFELEASIQQVTIDIKPGSTTNPIHLKSQGVIPVAILSTAAFDATTMVPSSVCFGDAEDASQRVCIETHGTGHWKDVNGDVRLDLLLHFEVQQTGIDRGDTMACLTGQTAAGGSRQGCDTIRVR